MKKIDFNVKQQYRFHQWVYNFNLETGCLIAVKHNLILRNFTQLIVNSVVAQGKFK